MSRYIDADAYEWELRTSNIIHHYGEQIVDKIHSAPSIDIVRCKECKHNYNTAINHGKMQPRCNFTDYKLTENDFCSRGERKDDE